MNEALIQNPENDVDREQSRQDQESLIAADGFVSCCRTLKISCDAARHIETFFRLLYGNNSLTERIAGRDVERNCDDGELSLMTDCEWGRAFAKAANCR